MHNYGNFPVWQCNSKTFNFSDEYMYFIRFCITFEHNIARKLFWLSREFYKSGVARMDDSTEAPIQKFPFPEDSVGW